jgi:uncharacterized protein YceK
LSLRALRLAIGAAVLLAGGCGTIVNLTDEVAPAGLNPGRREVYGGIRWDIDAAWPLGQPAASHNEYWPNLPRFFFFLLDLPCCAIADTVTLPYTAAYQLGLTSSGNSMTGPRRPAWVEPPVSSAPPAAPAGRAMNPRIE